MYCHFLRLLHSLIALLFLSQHDIVCLNFHINTEYEQLIMIPVLTPQSLNINNHFQHPISILEAITSLFRYTTSYCRSTHC